jgi:hypothetical protein
LDGRETNWIKNGVGFTWNLFGVIFKKFWDNLLYGIMRIEEGAVSQVEYKLLNIFEVIN